MYSGLDSIRYSNIDIDPCWIIQEEISDTENYIFTALDTCENTPTVTIKSAAGNYELQFKKSRPVIRISNGQLWYNRNDLIVIRKLG